MSTTYTVSVTRDGEWWMVAVRELDALTQARRLGDVDTAARELVLLETGTALDEVSIDMHVELTAGDGDLTARVADLRARRERIEAEEAAVRADTAAFARELAAARVPVRDIATLLGVQCGFGKAGG
ncbi:HicB family toxin-antitoxin system [Rhodococcoides corynebacterioides]|uniref:HicB family toxin-antitoxin system n=1 Tax=Rhodococcoides corynebacterioides TaxID=53972 RepID=UPI001C9ADF3E|nr:HicB family toxin-antitoxin system [Rhodococcus corynebacterioides]MBY6348760.1 HicB family toxin-antitoxin system [Rhodococcus corynebacterioides]MBY6361833.1 HicB family toxin-antitoxin system [Rhodococcus corynebacterioides]